MRGNVEPNVEPTECGQSASKTELDDARVPFEALIRTFQCRGRDVTICLSKRANKADLMLMLWMQGGALISVLFGITGYFARRHIERRREVEALALLIQTADLCTKLRQSGVTISELRALQDEVHRLEVP